jgi:hypothetical protein
MLAVHATHQRHTVGLDPITCGRLAAELTAAGIEVKKSTRVEAAQTHPWNGSPTEPAGAQLIR